MRKKLGVLGASTVMAVAGGVFVASPAQAYVNKSAKYSTLAKCQAVQSGPAYNNSFVRSSKCAKWVGAGGYTYYQFTYTTRTS